MGGLKQSQWTPTKRRGPIAAEFSGPGPAAVALPTLVGNFTTPPLINVVPLQIFSRHVRKMYVFDRPATVKTCLPYQPAIAMYSFRIAYYLRGFRVCVSFAHERLTLKLSIPVDNNNNIYTTYIGKFTIFFFSFLVFCNRTQ